MHADGVGNQVRPKGVRPDTGEAQRGEQKAHVQHEHERVMSCCETPPASDSRQAVCGGAAASAIRAVGAPSGATTQKASERPDSPRTAPSARPKGAGRSVSRGPGEPVAGEARRHAPADQEDQHDDEAERRPRGRVSDPGSGVLDVERDIYEREPQNDRCDFEVAPVPSGDHLARGERSGKTWSGTPRPRWWRPDGRSKRT